MIGVIPKSDQIAIVEEFFELFKTPWELYRPGRTYNVILATVDEIPEVNTKLLLVYGPSAKSVDASLGIIPFGRHRQVISNEGNTQLPVYGDLQTFAENCDHVACLRVNSETAGLKGRSPRCTVLRMGYDLFEEVRFLLSEGQPVENAHIPTLDAHITMLRNWILDEGIPLIEIPPVPAGHSFIVCLTHDIDFVGIRNHKFDHTMWGFLYRSTAGSIRKWMRGRISISRLLESWRAAFSLPFVYLGWIRDFWEPFEWYVKAEKGLAATYFLIPFKGRTGERVLGAHPSRRAAAYDVDDLSDSAAMLKRAGCELGVHGIDAWHSVEKGRAELAKIAGISGESAVGVRMHWLLQDANTIPVLEQAGYTYDSSAGYNETIGYRNGTSQVFRPLQAKTLLEIPLHIQDGALFYPNRLDLSEQEAERRCQELVDNARKFNGVLSLIWHDRSHGPERFWGDFYSRFLETLKSFDAWFATAGHAVNWFRRRREVCFESPQTANNVSRIGVRYDGEEIQPPLNIRIHHPPVRRPNRESRSETRADFTDIPYSGGSGDELDRRIAECVVESVGLAS